MLAHTNMFFLHCVKVDNPVLIFLYFAQRDIPLFVEDNCHRVLSNCIGILNFGDSTVLVFTHGIYEYIPCSKYMEHFRKVLFLFVCSPPPHPKTFQGSFWNPVWSSALRRKSPSHSVFVLVLQENTSLLKVSSVFFL